jgi:hypothetical protein
MVAKLPYLRFCNHRIRSSHQEGAAALPMPTPPIHDKNPALIRVQSVKPLEKQNKQTEYRITQCNL